MSSDATNHRGTETPRTMIRRSLSPCVSVVRKVWFFGLAAALLAMSGSAAGPAFFPDDPIQRDDDMALDAGGAGRSGSNGYDFTETPLNVGDGGDSARQRNTLDEVPTRAGSPTVSAVPRCRSRDRPRPNRTEPSTFAGRGAGGAPASRRGSASATRALYKVKFVPRPNGDGQRGGFIGAAVYHATATTRRGSSRNRFRRRSSSRPRRRPWTCRDGGGGGARTSIG